MSHNQNSQLLIYLEELKKAFNELAERIKSLDNEINKFPQAQSAIEEDGPGSNHPQDPSGNP